MYIFPFEQILHYGKQKNITYLSDVGLLFANEK